MSFFKWRSHAMSHHSFKLGVHRTCRFRDITFSFLTRDYIWSPDQSDLIVPYQKPSPCQVSSLKLCWNRDIMFFIYHTTSHMTIASRLWVATTCHTLLPCQMTSRDKVIEKTCDYLSSSNTLSRPVATGLVEVET